MILKDEFMNVHPGMWIKLLRKFGVNLNSQCENTNGQKLQAIDIAAIENRSEMIKALLTFGAEPGWLTPDNLKNQCFPSSTYLEQVLPGLCNLKPRLQPRMESCSIIPTWPEFLDFYGFNAKTLRESKNNFFYGLYLGITLELINSSTMPAVTITLISFFIQMLLLLLSGTYLSVGAGLATSVTLKRFGAFSDRKAQIAGASASCLVQLTTAPLTESVYTIATTASSLSGEYVGRVATRASIFATKQVHTFFKSDHTKFVELGRELIAIRNNNIKNSYFSQLPLNLITDHLIPCLGGGFDNYDVLLQQIKRP